MKLSQRKNPSGKKVWVLDLGRGPGQRKAYASKTKAQNALDQEKHRRTRHGEMLDSITPVEMAEIIASRAKAASGGFTISQAVDHFMAHGKRLQESLLLPDLAQRFRASREKQRLSPKYVDQLQVALKSISERFPLAYAHELTAKDVDAWLNSGSWSPKTKKNYLGDVSAMFVWAMLPAQGFARVNPCKGVELERKKRRGKVSTLTLEQSEQMLRTAAEQENWRVLAFCTLGLFGGLRPDAEAANPLFTWADINLEALTVLLTQEVVKTGPGRVVDLSKNAAAWLALIPPDLRKGPVVPSKNWQEVWMRFRHNLGWRVATDKGVVKRGLRPVEPVHGEWPKDVLRHTYASMHYAHYQNEALLQVQMGHTSRKMLHEHYRAVRTRQEAALFWALSPASLSA